MLRYLPLLLLLVIAISCGLLIAMFNGHEATINYGFGRATLPLVGVVLVTLALGAFIGMLMMLGVWFRAVRRGRQYRAELKRANKQIAELSQIPSALSPSAASNRSNRDMAQSAVQPALGNVQSAPVSSKALPANA